MARKRHNELMVGAFITIATGLFVLLLFFMGSLDSFLQESTVVEADFNDVQMLQAGDPVLVFGIKVGKVLSLRLLDPSESDRPVVRVAMRMPLECRRWLRRNTPVKIDKSLTGSISVLIREGDGEPLGDGERLQALPAADLGAVTEKVNEVLSEAEKLVTTISGMVKEIEANGAVTSAVVDLAALVKEVREEVTPIRNRLRSILEEVHEVIDENRLDVRHTIANFKETTALAKTFAERLETTPDLINRSLEEVQKAGSEAKNILVENRSHFDTILADLRQTSTNAANLTSEVKRRPWRLLYRPSESEKKAMDLYDAAWAYNLGATELNRSVKDLADQITRAERQGLPLETLKEAEDRVRQSLRQQRTAEDTFWDKLRAAD